MKKLWKQLFFLLAAFLLFCSESNVCYASQSEGIHVNYHTQEEILEYLSENQVDPSAETEYSRSASDESPYEPGRFAAKASSRRLRR